MDNRADDLDGPSRSAPEVTGGSDIPNMAERRWGVPPAIPLATGSVGLAFVGWFLFAGAAEDRLVAAVGAVLCAVATAALLTMRVRLVAGPTGFMLRGPTGTRIFSWKQVSAISAPTRRRRGLASTAVELDLDDDGLILLGRTELGADPVDVAEELRRWWWQTRDSRY